MTYDSQHHASLTAELCAPVSDDMLDNNTNKIISKLDATAPWAENLVSGVPDIEMRYQCLE